VVPQGAGLHANPQPGGARGALPPADDVPRDAPAAEVSLLMLSMSAKRKGTFTIPSRKVARTASPVTLLPYPKTYPTFGSGNLMPAVPRYVIHVIMPAY
jgi:hypothetical protein